LIAINTSQEIDAEKFGEYAFDTAKLLVDNYSWWPMSPTVHKVLIHGQDIIHYGILPVGMLTYNSNFLHLIHYINKIINSSFTYRANVRRGIRTL
jgi:hypothetical protein